MIDNIKNKTKKYLNIGEYIHDLRMAINNWKMMNKVGYLKIKISVYQKTPLRKWNESPNIEEDVWNTCNKEGAICWIYKDLPPMKKNTQEEKSLAILWIKG